MKTENVLIALLSISLIFSCSVEKRKHLSGWNIQWRGKAESPAPYNRKEKKILVKADSTEILLELERKQENILASTSDLITIEEKIDYVLPIEIIEPIPVEKEKQNEEEKKIDWNGIFGFGFLILSVPLPFLFFIPLYFGAFSRKAWRQSPEDFKPNAYKYRWMGELAFWLPLAFVMLVIPILLLIVLISGSVGFLAVALLILILALPAFIIGMQRKKDKDKKGRKESLE